MGSQGFFLKKGLRRIFLPEEVILNQGRNFKIVNDIIASFISSHLKWIGAAHVNFQYQ